MEFKDWLKAKRFEHRMTQRDLAEKLSVHVKTVSNWECGRFDVTLKNLGKIEKLFKEKYK